MQSHVPAVLPELGYSLNNFVQTLPHLRRSPRLIVNYPIEQTERLPGKAATQTRFMKQPHDEMQILNG